MKKLSVHLSLLCLLAFLLIPFVGCKKEEPETEESPAATTEMETTTEPMSTEMGTTEMGTDMGTMGTDMSSTGGK